MVDITPNADLDKTINTLDNLKYANQRIIKGVIAKACVDSKKYIRRSFKSMLKSISGETLKSIKHKVNKDGSGVIWMGKRKSAYPNVFGATILPKKGEYLYFTGDDGQLRRMKSVTIPERDFFFPTLDKYFNSGTPEKVMQNEMNRRILKEWNKQ
jgi:hypothetical protein